MEGAVRSRRLVVEVGVVALVVEVGVVALVAAGGVVACCRLLVYLWLTLAAAWGGWEAACGARSSGAVCDLHRAHLPPVGAGRDTSREKPAA